MPTKLALIVACGDDKLVSTEVSAARIKKCLENSHGFDVDVVAGAEATRNRVQAWLGDRPLTLGEGDAFVFIYIGHGVKVRDPAFRKSDLHEAPMPAELLLLGTYDLLSARDERVAGLPGVDLIDWLRPVAAATGNVTIILDCCHAAGLARDGSSPETRRACTDTYARAVEAVRKRHPVTRNLEASDPLAAADRSIVRLVATIQNDIAVEGPGLDGKTPKIGLFSDAVATSLARTDAPALTWDDHIVAIRTMIKPGSPIQRPGVEGPRHRFPFTTTSRPPTDSAACRPDGRRYQINAGQLHGVEPGDVFQIVRIADGAILGESAAYSVAIHDALLDLPLRSGAHTLRSPGPETSLSFEPGATFVGEPAPRSRLPLEPGPPAPRPPATETGLSFELGATSLGESAVRARLPLESATHSRLPSEPAPSSPDDDALRAVPVRRICPIPIAVDPDPGLLAHLDPVRLARIGVALVRPDRVPADTLELRDDSLRLRTREGHIIHTNDTPDDPAATHTLIHALWRLAHYRRVLRGAGALAHSRVDARFAWGLAGHDPFLDVDTDIAIPEDSALWFSVRPISNSQLFVDVFHLRADCSIRHLTADFDHGHTANRSAVTSLTQAQDSTRTPWLLPWPTHVPRDEPVRERLMVVFSSGPRSLHQIAFESTLNTRGESRPGALAPLVKFLDFRLHPAAQPPSTST